MQGWSLATVCAPLMRSAMLLLIIMRFMRTALTVVSLLALGGIFVLAQSAASSRMTALSLLRLSEPNVAWNPRTLLKADFDYDGVVDYALGGRRGSSYVLGVVKGTLSGKSKHWMLEFSQDAGNQGGLCSVVSTRIKLEQLSVDEVGRRRKIPRKSRGINLYDGECDSFHIYYDQKEERFVWWRL